MKKTQLKKYADLIVNTGAHVQRGQEVVINASIEQPEFVTMVADACYRAGAKKVTVDWSYQPLTMLNIKRRSRRVLGTYDDWEVARLNHYADTLPAMIHILSDDPDGMRGIDHEKLAASQQKRYVISKPIQDRMENKYQWCIAAVPGAAWAKKVFPNEIKSRAIEHLWEAILNASRADDDPIKAWADHNEDLAARCKYLNSLGIKALHYTASNGTDLRVGMIDGGMFCGGGEYTLGSNVFYNPNIPSEECFTSPKRGEAEGIVYATKPLSYYGKLIENFSVRFEGGRAVEVKAETNEELLRTMIGMDEGASYLGEAALVPYDSPISNSGILYYNTLFDENAACHLALGSGFENCLEGYENYTHEQCRELGINDSMIHVDFMIGCRDLSIVAETRDGGEVEIFKNGNWAF